MDINVIKNIVAEKTAILLYFYNDNCAPCKLLRPKVQALIESDFPAMEFFLINTEQSPEVAAEFGVFASPTILVFFEGKEFIRESKNVSISELHFKIVRYYNLLF
jgi:thioredoxin 1